MPGATRPRPRRSRRAHVARELPTASTFSWGVALTPTRAWRPAAAAARSRRRPVPGEAQRRRLRAHGGRPSRSPRAGAAAARPRTRDRPRRCATRLVESALGLARRRRAAARRRRGGCRRVAELAAEALDAASWSVSGRQPDAGTVRHARARPTGGSAPACASCACGDGLRARGLPGDARPIAARGGALPRATRRPGGRSRPSGAPARASARTQLLAAGARRVPRRAATATRRRRRSGGGDCVAAPAGPRGRLSCRLRRRPDQHLVDVDVRRLRARRTSRRGRCRRPRARSIGGGCRRTACRPCRARSASRARRCSSSSCRAASPIAVTACFVTE